MSVRTEIIEITPEVAIKWLEKTTIKNRSLSRRKLAQYTEEMKQNRWTLNGEAIILDKDGNVLNGQHRLTACINSRTPFKTLVVHGVDKDVMPTIDTGKARSARDVFIMNSYPNEAAAAARMVWQYEHAERDKTWKEIDPPHQDLLEWMEKHPELNDSIRQVVNIKKLRQFIIPSWAIAIHYVFSRKDRALADIFFAAVASGENLSAADPVYHLRQKLIENATAKRRFPKHEMFSYFIKTWNKVRKGETLDPTSARNRSALIRHRVNEKFPTAG